VPRKIRVQFPCAIYHMTSRGDLQDSTSPEHQGFQGWDGHPDSLAAAKHGLGEDFDPGAGSALDAATKAAWDYFKGAKSLPSDFFTFGYDAKPKK